MNISVYPQTKKFAAALVAAGVMSAASVVALPEHRALPTVSAEVVNASVITDALYDAGIGVGFLSSMVGIHVDAVISVPFEATLAIMAAARNPELGPNVLSYLVQRFVNPAVGDPIHAYPYDTEQAFALLATLFPYPLGPSATEPGVINEARLAFADVFNSVLGQLPDPLPGLAAVNDVMHNTVLGGLVYAGNLALRIPLNTIWDTVDYLGMLPANLEATFESAFKTPGQIPGLISNLVYSLLSPDAQVGLLGKLVHTVVDPFTFLPGPIGYSSDLHVGWANQIRDVITGVINGMLSLLPPAVTPSVLPSAAGTQSQVVESERVAEHSAEPDALLSVPAKIAEKAGDTVTLTTEDPAPLASVTAPESDVSVPQAPAAAVPPAAVPEASAADAPEADNADDSDSVRPHKAKRSEGKPNSAKSRAAAADSSASETADTSPASSDASSDAA